jgi:hypothetical protein
LDNSDGRFIRTGYLSPHRIARLHGIGLALSRDMEGRNIMMKLGAWVAVLGVAIAMGGCAVDTGSEPAPTDQNSAERGGVGLESVKVGGSPAPVEPPPAPPCSSGSAAVWDATTGIWFCPVTIQGVCTKQCSVATPPPPSAKT